MQFRTKSQQSSITLIFLGSLSLTLPLVGLYLYPYWTGKLMSKIVFFVFWKKDKSSFSSRMQILCDLLKQKFPSLSLVTRIIFSTTVYRGISDRTLEVGPRNESFPRNICSRGLSYFPPRLDGRARKTVYEMRKTCSQDLFTQVRLGSC